MPDDIDIIKPNQPQTPTEPENTEQEQPTDFKATEQQTLPPASAAEPTVSNEPFSPPTQPPVSPPVHSEPKRGGPKLWVILLLIILVAVTSVAAALYISKSDDKEAATTTSTKKDIAHLRYALPDGDVSKFYPIGNTATSVQLNSQVFEGLVRYDEQTKVVPQLATNWSNPDTSTWTFDLRKDVKFHSGKTMTAKDVKYSLDYAVAHQEDENTNLFIAASIKQVDVVNDYQIKITTDGPDPILLNRLAYLYIMDSDVEVGDPNGGSGPYAVKTGTTPTETNVELTAVDSYYGGHIYTKSISLTLVPQSEDMITAINNDEYDLAGSLEPNELTKVKNYEPIVGQNFSVGFLGLNTLKEGSPLATKEGRQAAAYALDIPKILKAGNLGGEPTGQLIPPKIPGHDPSIKDASYDPAKAKELLAKVPDATAPLKLSYGGEDNLGHLTEIANQLKAVGFNVTLDEQPDLEALVGAAFSGETDMFYIVYDSPTLDGYDFFSSILQGNAIYDNQELSDQIDEAASVIDPSERLTILKKINKEVAEDVPVVPLYVPLDAFALRKPYYIQTDIPGAQAGVYFWQTYQK